jgi:hypothetical protein
MSELGGGGMVALVPVEQPPPGDMLPTANESSSAGEIAVNGFNDLSCVKDNLSEGVHDSDGSVDRPSDGLNDDQAIPGDATQDQTIESSGTDSSVDANAGANFGSSDSEEDSMPGSEAGGNENAGQGSENSLHARAPGNRPYDQELVQENTSKGMEKAGAGEAKKEDKAYDSADIQVNSKPQENRASRVMDDKEGNELRKDDNQPRKDEGGMGNDENEKANARTRGSGIWKQDRDFSKYFPGPVSSGGSGEKTHFFKDSPMEQSQKELKGKRAGREATANWNRAFVQHAAEEDKAMLKHLPKEK